MNLRAKQFERRLRIRVRAALKSSPPLLKEYRRLRGGRQHHVRPWVGRIVLGVVFVALFVGVSQPGRPLPWALTALTFWITGSCFWHALRLGYTLFHSKDLVVYHHLPLLDHEVFSLQWRKHVRQSPLMLFYLTTIYFMLARDTEPWWGALGASLLFGLVQTSMVVALGCLVLRWVPQMMLLGSGLAFSGLALSMLCFRLFVASWETGMAPVAALLPTGWIPFVFLHAFTQGDGWCWFVLLPAGLVAATVVYSQRKLHEAYRLSEPDRTPTLAQEIRPDASPSDSIYSQRGTTDLEDSIRERQFLTPEPWREKGWMEKLAGRSMTSREDIVSDFLVGNSFGGTAALHRAVKAAAIGAIAIWFFGQFNGWIIFLALFFVGILALPLLDGGGRGLRMCFLGSGYSPAFAGFPISSREIIVTIWKLNVVRCVTAVPLAVGMGAMAGTKLALGPVAGLLWGLKVWALALALQPVFIIFRLSNGTNDSERIRLSTLAISVPTLLALLGLVAKFLLAGTAPDALLWLALLTVASAAMAWLYSRAFERSRFDLLRQSSGDKPE